MYGMFGLVSRPAGVSPAEFRRWWTKDHVPRVMRMPGLRHYTIIPADRGFDLPTGQWTEQPSYAGLAITLFDDAAAMDVALASPEGMANRRHNTGSNVASLNFAGTPIVNLGHLSAG